MCEIGRYEVPDPCLKAFFLLLNRPECRQRYNVCTVHMQLSNSSSLSIQPCAISKSFFFFFFFSMAFRFWNSLCQFQASGVPTRTNRLLFTCVPSDITYLNAQGKLFYWFTHLYLLHTPYSVQAWQSRLIYEPCNHHQKVCQTTLLPNWCY